MTQTLRGMHTPRRTKEGSCAAVRRRAKSGSLPLKIEGLGCWSPLADFFSVELHIN